MTWLNDLTLDTVIVHTTGDGPSVRGLKRAVYDDCLVLSDAALLDPEQITALDGDIAIPREKVLFMQIIDGVSA